MPQSTNAKRPLAAVIKAATQSALAGVTLTNTSVSLASTHCYYGVAPEAAQGRAYCVMFLQNAVDGVGSDRFVEESDILGTFTCWAPDPLSALEMAEGIEENLTARASGTVTNISVTGFLVHDVQRMFQEAVIDQRAGLAPYFGENLGLRFLMRPT